MNKILKIKDINNKKYIVENVDEFIHHINECHSKGSSLHEENGCFFNIDEFFRELINQVEDNKKWKSFCLIAFQEKKKNLFQ